MRNPSYFIDRAGSNTLRGKGWLDSLTSLVYGLSAAVKHPLHLLWPGTKTNLTPSRARVTPPQICKIKPILGRGVSDAAARATASTVARASLTGRVY